MTNDFSFDVFLLCSTKDIETVKSIASRLRADRLEVWFNERDLLNFQANHSVIEYGLERSQILVFCISANALGVEWERLKACTTRFRDPSNKVRRFIPLRLDKTDVPKDLDQYNFINWVHGKRRLGYLKLLKVCQLAMAIPELKDGVKKEFTEEKVFSLGHSEPINDFVLNSNGSKALTAGRDCTIRLWEIETGKCLQVLEGHEEGVVCVAWFPDEVHAISYAGDDSIRFWNIQTGKCLQVIDSDDLIDSFNVLAASPDGMHVVAGSRDTYVRVWNVQTGKCLYELKGHTDVVVCVAFSPDGTWFLSGSSDKTIRMWEMATGKCVKVFKGHTDDVNCVAWRSDGAHIVSGSSDGCLRFWDVISGDSIGLIKASTISINKVSYSMDDKYVLSVSAASARLWMVETGECIKTLKFGRDGNDKLIWQRDTSANAEVHIADTIRLWKLHNKNYIKAVEGEPINHIALSQDRKYVLTGSEEGVLRLWKVPEGICVQMFHVVDDFVGCVDLSPNGEYALSDSSNHIIRIWNISTGKCVKELKEHGSTVLRAIFSPDGRFVLSSSVDNKVRLWDWVSGKCLQVMAGDKYSTGEIALSPNGKYVLSYDNTMRLWDVHTGKCLRKMKGHKYGPDCIAWSPDGVHAITGSEDKTLRLWNIDMGTCIHIMEGHTDGVICAAWNKDGVHVVTGSHDNTVRVWNITTGRCISVITGHRNGVIMVGWEQGNNKIISVDFNGICRIWEVILDENEHIMAGTPGQQVTYCNTKVLLVGDSGVGKTGLSNYLALGKKDDGSNTSSDGAWATQWALPHNLNEDGVEKEIWLWDFAGQVDYRLVHQLFMDETAAAVLVFNPQQENPFEGLGQWDRDLQKSSRKTFSRLLAAGRVDRGGLIVNESAIEVFMKERGFIFPLHYTSAKTGEGCVALRESILRSINWEQIPKTTSPILYQNIKREILKLRDSGIVLIRFEELKQQIEKTLPGHDFTLDELHAVIGLLDGPGMIQRLDIGNYILLRPEVLSRYAAAVIRKVRKHPKKLGCISENDMLNGELDYQDFERLPAEEEKILLRTLYEKMINRAWCLRQLCDGTTLLIFPSYFRRQRPEQPVRPHSLVTYRFSGPIEDIYATLVVRLHHTGVFESEELWKDAADFSTQTDQWLGLKLVREVEGTAKIEVFFTPGVDENTRLVFVRYIHNHLYHHGKNVERLRHYFCTNKKCEDYSLPFTDQTRIDRALTSGGSGKVFCPACGKPILLRDIMEKKFESNEVKQKADRAEENSQLKIDTESLELILVGHTFAIAAEAGQIFRPTANSDHGIDGEIEFKDNEGKASGKRLYVQLKSGDSYLTKRKRDAAEVFQIKNERWAKYWQQQAYPVMLVVRNSKGEIRWMNVSDYLQKENNMNGKPITQIIFKGEPFNAASIHRWRNKMLYGENNS